VYHRSSREELHGVSESGKNLERLSTWLREREKLRRRDRPLPADKVTDYKLDGKQIVLRKRGRPVLPRNPLFVSQEKKVEACSLYCVLGTQRK